MKKITKSVFVLFVLSATLFTQGGSVLAQSYGDYDPYGNNDTGYTNYDPYGTYGNYDPYGNTGTGYTNYDPYGTYGNYDPYGTTGTGYTNYDPTTYSNYDPGYSYTPSYDYTPSTTGTYGNTDYGTYTSTAGNYGTFGTYGTTGYTSTGFTGWTNTGTTCQPGQTLVNGSCIWSVQCEPGYVLQNGQCVVTTITCPSGTTLENGQCVRITTTCPSGTTLVNGQCVGTTNCPSGTTLINGQCVGTTTCPSGTTLVNGQCVGTGTCPAGTTLINGTCQYGTSCPTGSTMVNGVCQITNVTCPSGSTLINGVCQAPITCPAGTVYVNGICQGTGTTSCPYGSTLINGICQINTTACPLGSTLINGICQINSTSCPYGTVFVNGSCQYTTTTFTNGTTQTCWDGSVIPSSHVCPSQFRTCLDGSVIPVYQTCRQTTYRPPQLITFNNVVTSITTEISKTSARCNGIGLIASNASSVGWFEYGETPNLGRTTTRASIGQSATAPFSNVLTNLKPTTTYFCRAVMSNQYGTVKGEIVKFTTKGTAVSYVKPVAKAPVSKKPVSKKPEVICADGTTVNIGSETQASMLSEGKKIVTIQIEKVQGDVAPGRDVIYKMTYKNLSEVPVSNLTVKVAIPTSAIFVGSTAGNYDANTNTLTMTQSTLPPFGEGILTWTIHMKNDAAVGQSVVTSAYVLYAIDAQGKTLQDEVTSYSIDTIAQPIATPSDDGGAKHVVGKGVSFLPQTLVEWLALIAIVFIIAILARSVYLSRKERRY